VNGDVRRIVSDTLGLLRDVRGVKPLIPILDDPDPNIHDAAKRALKRITGQDFGGDHTKWNEWASKN
jgi:HEAT repeat protein